MRSLLCRCRRERKQHEVLDEPRPLDNLPEFGGSLVGAPGAGERESSQVAGEHEPDLEGLRERPHEPLGDAQRLRLVLDRVAQHGELVAAEARDRVRGPQHGLQARADGAQQLVPGVMAERGTLVEANRGGGWRGFGILGVQAQGAAS